MAQFNFINPVYLYPLEIINECKDLFSNINLFSVKIGIIISIILLILSSQEIKPIINYSAGAIKDLAGKILVGAVTGAAAGAVNAITTDAIKKDGGSDKAQVSKTSNGDNTPSKK